ncbi:hypothetical protein V22_19620 [Calycomorphotria hydatis]|uniref:Uncharacterized protein n=1 Tax=Calycomorphotria hydatis TaxID=2528027 RepID=A0A517T8K8_9PLAN|nr:hypothetical protein V22_19620 [Calycomorphotria hydatis]
MRHLREELETIGRCPGFRLVAAKSVVAAFAFGCLGSWFCCELSGTYDEPQRIPTARPSKLITKLVTTFVGGDEKPSRFRVVPQASGSEADIPKVQPPPRAPTHNPDYMEYLGFHSVQNRGWPPVEAPRPPLMLGSDNATMLMESYEKWKKQPFRPAEEFYIDDRWMPVFDKFGGAAGEIAPPLDAVID